MKGSRSRWFVAALFLLALLVQIVLIRRQITYYDEALELYCAERVLHGQLPYRDFWTLYGPAQFYFLAIFFKLFGITVLVGRLYDALVKAGIACMVFVFVSRLASRRSAVFAFVASLLCLTCNTSAIYNFPIFPALLCSLLSVYFLSRFLAEPGKLSLLCIAGLLTGLTTTFRHDSGFYICFATCATLVWAQRRIEPSSSSLLQRLTIYLAGVLAIFLPVLAWLVWKVPAHDLYFDLVYVPGKVYPKVRSLPFPTFAAHHPYFHHLGKSTLYALEEWIVYLPILVVATALATLLLMRKASRPLWDAEWRRFTFGALALLTALLYLKGLIRVTEVHQLPTIVLAIALTAILLSRRARLSQTFRVPAFACGLFLSGYILLLLSNAATFLRWNVRDIVRRNYHESVYNTCHPPAGLERARCLVVDASTIATVQDVEQLTGPTDPIYVGAGRHDKLSSNDVRLQFLTARPSITKWYDLHPGVQTTLPIQNEMIESIRAQSPKVIVLNDAFDDIEEPNASRYSSGVTVLDDYISSHYIEQGSIGPYSILVPRTTATTQAAGSDSK